MLSSCYVHTYVSCRIMYISFTADQFVPRTESDQKNGVDREMRRLNLFPCKPTTPSEFPTFLNVPGFFALKLAYHLDHFPLFLLPLFLLLLLPSPLAPSRHQVQLISISLNLLYLFGNVAFYSHHPIQTLSLHFWNIARLLI